MEYEEKSFCQLQKSRNINSFANQLSSFSIKLHNPHQIYKTSKEITGVITLVPKVPMLNIPIQLTIVGESQCTVFEEEVNENSFLVKDLFEGPKSFRIHETQEELVERKNEAEKCLQSTQFLSQSYTDNNKHLAQQSYKEIFLDGKQQLFQTKHQNQDQKSQKKLKLLQQNETYIYQFSFFLPVNVPISVNSKIFPGVHLFVGYRIEAGFQLDEKFILCEEGLKAKYLKEGRSVKVCEVFEVKRVVENFEEVTVSNRLSFKFFNSEGEISSQQPSLTSCLMKCLCPSLWRRCYCYDLYHCQLLSSINEFRILHLTARIFLEPNKEKIDVRKVKKGKLYMTNKKADPEEIDDDKPKGRSEMTNSKIMPQKETKSEIKIHQIKIIFYGEIVGVKKVTIFEKVISLDRENYDAVEGELILELVDSYFSEKNELFQIRYWFEIQPLNPIQNESLQQQAEKIELPNKDGQFNEFDITIGKLIGNLNSKKNQNKTNQNRSKENKKYSNSTSSKFKVEIFSEWHHFIRM